MHIYTAHGTRAVHMGFSDMMSIRHSVNPNKALSSLHEQPPRQALAKRILDGNCQSSNPHMRSPRRNDLFICRGSPEHPVDHGLMHERKHSCELLHACHCQATISTNLLTQTASLYGNACQRNLPEVPDKQSTGLPLYRHMCMCEHAGLHDSRSSKNEF